MNRNEHLQDEDCAGHIDPETDCCKVCGVYHGAPCQECGGRGFHTPGCPESDETRERLAILARHRRGWSGQDYDAILEEYRKGWRFDSSSPGGWAYLTGASARRASGGGGHENA